MKNLLLTFSAICLIGGLAFYFGQRQQIKNSAPAPGATSPGASQQATPIETSLLTEERVREAVPAPVVASPAHPAGEVVGSAVPVKVSNPLPFQQMMQTLTSSQSGFDQKQGVWQQLKDSGKLDLAIGDLEQRANANPNSAEYPAALGQGYLQKAGLLKDIREQGILGMKADQSFDAALTIDPSNWEAGFWKAAAMSYWPPQLGKGQEVIERFAQLIQQQETQPAQPQFAQTYVLLGEQYQKQGYPDYARQIWQRGAGFFPNNPQLQDKLSQIQVEQTAAR